MCMMQGSAALSTWYTVSDMYNQTSSLDLPCLHLLGLIPSPKYQIYV